MQDDSWKLKAQPVVTDMMDTSDPQHYDMTNVPVHYNITQSTRRNFQTVQSLPSFDLSPESLGVEENLFGSPDYTVQEEKELIMKPLELGVGAEINYSRTTV